MNIHNTLFSALVLLSAACVEAPEHYYGARSETTFVVYSDSVGVYPNDDVVVDPNNPVAMVPIGDCPNVPLGETPAEPCTETKWIVEANTDGTGSPCSEFLHLGDLACSRTHGRASILRR